MDLMSETTTFSSLKKKYYDFQAPTVEISISGTKMVASEDVDISELEVELTSGYEASGCVFVLQNVYEDEQTDFKKYVDKIQLGEVVEVFIGYVRVESVFKGYINRIEYLYGVEDDLYEIRVECMDVKGLLMKTRRMEFFTQKSADAVVNAILGEQPVSSYLSGKEIESCSEEEVPLRSHMMTDYDLIVEQASKQGFEFFILQGKAYFRPRQKVTSTLIKLSMEDGLINARFSISAQELVKKIEVRSIDENNGEQIKGEAVLSGNFGKGSKKLLGESRQVFYEPGVKDANEAKARAAARMNAIAGQFGELELECIGIPELAPGRFIEIEKLSSQANRKYYVNYVRHVIDEDGFKTYVKAGVNSL